MWIADDMGIYHPTDINDVKKENGMNCAQIIDGVVTNIAFFTASSADIFKGFVPYGDKPVQIGDTYIDGKFYRDGVELLSPLEETESAIDELLIVLGGEL